MTFDYEPKFSAFDTKKNVKLPKEMSIELAELIGILAGDGCIASYKDKKGTEHRYVSVTGSSENDQEYFNYVSALIEHIFNVKPRYFKVKNQNTIRLTLSSKAVFHFLKDIGLNVGRKDNLEIPKIILENTHVMQYFLRGLFDTDGSIALKSYNHEYPVISIKLKSRKIIEQLEVVLKDMEFPMYVEYDVITNDKRGFISKASRIYIYGRKNLKKWVEIIGFKNPRHLKKIERGMGRVGFSPTIKRP